MIKIRGTFLITFLTRFFDQFFIENLITKNIEFRWSYLGLISLAYL